VERLLKNDPEIRAGNEGKRVVFPSLRRGPDCPDASGRSHAGKTSTDLKENRESIHHRKLNRSEWWLAPYSTRR
jgi:hypothetical protein